jgi:hypothetical protein
VTTLDLVAAKVRAAGLIALAVWLIAGLGAGTWIVHTAWRWGGLADWWDRQYLGLPAWKVWVVVPLYLGGSYLLIWRSLVDGLWIGLSGRQWIFLGCLALYLLSPCLSATLFPRTDDHPLQAMLRWWACAAVLLKLLAAAGFAYALARRGLAPPAALMKGFAIWGLVVAGLFLVMFALFPEDNEHEPGLRMWVYMIRSLTPPALPLAAQLGLVAVLLVPLARLTAAPLALEWNRHR